MKCICILLIACLFSGKVKSQVTWDTLSSIRFNPYERLIDSTLNYYMLVVHDIAPEKKNRSNYSKKYPLHGHFIISEMVRITDIKAIDTSEDMDYIVATVIDNGIVVRWKRWISNNYNRLYWDCIERRINVRRKN